jgi:hypothetical protein
MSTIIEVFKIPSYLACYVANDDPSNLTDNEIEEYHDFLEKIKKLDNQELQHVSIGEDLGFYHFNNINSLGNDCIELIAFYKIV